MIWNDHTKLKGQHAILAPSSSSTWFNYDETKLYSKVASVYAPIIGTALHELAADLITYKIKLKSTDKNMIMLKLLQTGVPIEFINIDYIFTNFKEYVNDAIGLNMDSEVVLYATEQCYGTADAIIFANKTLRIHDLKTGTTPAHMEQLLTYAALFCIEYKYKPIDISIELRIYQDNEIVVCKPDPGDIVLIMELIDKNSKLITEWKRR